MDILEHNFATFEIDDSNERSTVTPQFLVEIKNIQLWNYAITETFNYVSRKQKTRDSLRMSARVSRKKNVRTVEGKYCNQVYS